MICSVFLFLRSSWGRFFARYYERCQTTVGDIARACSQNDISCSCLIARQRDIEWSEVEREVHCSGKIFNWSEPSPTGMPDNVTFQIQFGFMMHTSSEEGDFL